MEIALTTFAALINNIIDKDNMSYDDLIKFSKDTKHDYLDDVREQIENYIKDDRYTFIKDDIENDIAGDLFESDNYMRDDVDCSYSLGCVQSDGIWITADGIVRADHLTKEAKKNVFEEAIMDSLTEEKLNEFMPFFDNYSINVNDGKIDMDYDYRIDGDLQYDIERLLDDALYDYQRDLYHRAINEILEDVTDEDIEEYCNAYDISFSYDIDEDKVIINR